MSARIGRGSAVVTVLVFALIAAAWATVQAGASTPPPQPQYTPCLNTPCPDLPNPQQVETNAYGQAYGTYLGSWGDTQYEADSTVGGVNNGYGPDGAPGVTGAPASDAAGGYEEATGASFAGSTACSVGNARAGNACDNNNKYACWGDYVETGRKYTSAIYWDWITHLTWCGYSLGSITSHSYDDHWGIGLGYQCNLTNQMRMPLEKINNGHWQEHSEFQFTCDAGGLHRQDNSQEGFHFYSNGYDQRIERGGS